MVKCIHDTDIITISRNVFSLTLFAVCMLKNKKNKCGEVERESVTTTKAKDELEPEWDQSDKLLWSAYILK